MNAIPNQTKPESADGMNREELEEREHDAEYQAELAEFNNDLRNDR